MASGNELWKRKCWVQDMSPENQTLKHGKGSSKWQGSKHLIELEKVATFLREGPDLKNDLIKTAF